MKRDPIVRVLPVTATAAVSIAEQQAGEYDVAFLPGVTTDVLVLEGTAVFGGTTVKIFASTPHPRVRLSVGALNISLSPHTATAVVQLFPRGGCGCNDARRGGCGPR